MTIREWLEACHLHPDPETYLAHGYLDLCLRAWPSAKGQPLRLAAQWAVWTWLVDDSFDADDPAISDVTPVLVGAVDDEPLPADTHPLAVALGDLCSKTRAIMPGWWWGRFREALGVWLATAEAKLLSYLRPGRTPSLAEYLRLRPDDGGMQLAAMWCEVANLCVTLDWRDPLVQELVAAFSACGILLNDLAAAPGDTFTAVQALVHAEAMSIEQARAEVEQLLAAEERRFAVRLWAARAQSVGLAGGSVLEGEVREDTAQFARALDQFRRALAEWTRESSRYVWAAPADDGRVDGGRARATILAPTRT
ncbi:terpene synthase family protein [Kitasatospora sp. LaBMicrA B282]|uniref:terpene synthase family protein n=1 Tax=Kitasatospora sp. LaBMicrA B282 TaxID=3420949 RepID=UPI003D0B40C3